MIWEVPDPVRSAAMARPDDAALLFGDDVWTWRDLDGAVGRAAAGLAQAGVVRGTRVALAGSPSGRWVVNLFGILRIGAVAAPLAARAPRAERRQAEEALQATHVIDVDVQPRWTLPPAGESWHAFDDPALRLLTSGTTGRPRPVDLSWGQLVMSVSATALRQGRRLGDRWLCCLPLHHVGGLMILVREAFGAGSVLLHDRFEADRVARALDGGRITGVSLAPAMLAAVLDARPAARPFPDTLRTILVGGERTPPALTRRCEHLGAPVVDAWGMTETTSHVTLGDPAVPSPFTRVEADASGRLVVRGPVAGGVLATGDVGRVTPDGAVWVEGRVDAVLTSGGQSYHPAEVEDVLAEHPGVGDAAVTAQKDDRWGQRPAAILVPRPGTKRPSDQELADWCRDRLSRHKLPVRFEWTERLPRKMADA